MAHHIRSIKRDAHANTSAASASKLTCVPDHTVGAGQVQTIAVDGQVYVVGGNSFEIQDGETVVVNDAGLNEVYDPATDSWTTLTPVPMGANHTAIAALDGKIYIAGGFTERRHGNSVDWFYAYEIATDTWEALTPLSRPLGAPATIAFDGKIHLIGGRTTDEEGPLDIHEVYDPENATWTSAVPLPTARDHVGIEIVDGKIHVYGGRTAGGAFPVGLHDIYDPATDSWSSAPPMPTARSSAAYARYRGMPFFIGGECRDERAFDENEAYNPETMVWHSFAPMPVGRHASGAAVVGDTLYLVGGTHGCGSNGPTTENLAFTLP